MAYFRMIPLFLIACLAAVAADPPAGGSGETAPGSKTKRKFDFKTGTITVGASLATIKLPDGYRFLGPADARYMLEEIFHNPPDSGVLGLVWPPLQDDREPWFVVVSFEESGYVKDDDAKSLDYAQLLKDMQESTKAGNTERKRQGYDTVDLLGWAEPPHYDQSNHKLYWAKRLAFEGNPKPTLNYCVRVLGRRGCLELNAVADDTQLAVVAEGAKAVLATTELNAGHRYQDFDGSVDKVAAYGIGGLIAGGVLLKTGLLKLLIKPLIFAALIVGGILMKVLAKRKNAG
jgi:uncharacterized membrane-anchored protein